MTSVTSAQIFAGAEAVRGGAIAVRESTLAAQLECDFVDQSCGGSTGRRGDAKTG
jgi:hypothetical protein